MVQDPTVNQDNNPTIRISNIGGPLCRLPLTPGCTVADVKIEVESKTHVPKGQQALLHGLDELWDTQVLDDIVDPAAYNTDLTLLRQWPVESTLLEMVGITENICATMEKEWEWRPRTPRDMRNRVLPIALGVASSIVAAATGFGFPGNSRLGRVVPWMKDRWGSARPPAFQGKDVRTGMQGLILNCHTCVIHGFCPVRVRLSKGVKALLEADSIDIPEDLCEVHHQGWTLGDLRGLRERYPSSEIRSHVEQALKNELQNMASVTTSLHLESFALEEVNLCLSFKVYGWDGDILGSL